MQRHALPCGMVRRPRLLKLVRSTAITLFCALLLLSLGLRLGCLLFQRQAEHLMADFDTLTMRHSTWVDAQRLMTSWGEYGSYKGSCTADQCSYDIVLESPLTRFAGLLRSRSVPDPLFAAVMIPLEVLGGRDVMLRVGFQVQAGTVQRKSAGFWYQVPPGATTLRGYVLTANVQTLCRVVDMGWSLTPSSQLVDHPYYRVSAGHCFDCLIVRVKLVPDTPVRQVHELTNFNLTCITRLLPCGYVEEIYPASEPWHLYDGTYGGRPETAESKAAREKRLPIQCPVPLFARGREADAVLVVTPLTVTQGQYGDEPAQLVTAKVDKILKSSGLYKESNVVQALYSEVWNEEARRYEVEVPITIGTKMLFVAFEPPTKESGTFLERCSVLADSAGTEAGLMQGVAQDDSIQTADRGTFF